MFDDDQFVGVQKVEQFLRELRLHGHRRVVFNLDQALLDALFSIVSRS